MQAEITAHLTNVARKCIYKASTIASAVKTAKQNIESATRAIQRRSHEASMTANVMDIAATRAEIFTDPTPHETERRLAEAQSLSVAALMARLQLACARECLKENERLLEAATVMTEIRFRLCELAIVNLRRIDETSLLRAKEIEGVLSSIEEVKESDLRPLAPYNQR